MIGLYKITFSYVVFELRGGSPVFIDDRLWPLAREIERDINPGLIEVGDSWNGRNIVGIGREGAWGRPGEWIQKSAQYILLVRTVTEVVTRGDFRLPAPPTAPITITYRDELIGREVSLSHVAWSWHQGLVGIIDADGNGYDDRGEFDRGSPLFDDTANTVDFDSVDPASVSGPFNDAMAGDDVVVLPSSPVQAERFGLDAGWFSGGSGHDHITATTYSMQLFGRQGNDTLYGSTRGDIIEGGEDADRLYHTADPADDDAADALFGGPGSDVFVIGDGDTVADGEVGEIAVLEGRFAKGNLIISDRDAQGGYLVQTFAQQGQRFEATAGARIVTDTPVGFEVTQGNGALILHFRSSSEGHVARKLEESFADTADRLIAPKLAALAAALTDGAENELSGEAKQAAAAGFMAVAGAGGLNGNTAMAFRFVWKIGGDAFDKPVTYAEVVGNLIGHWVNYALGVYPDDEARRAALNKALEPFIETFIGIFKVTHATLDLLGAVVATVVTQAVELVTDAISLYRASLDAVAPEHSITAIGGSENDTLIGGIGDDRLIGGAGADRMLGGAGNDSYVVDDAADRIVETRTGGVDTLYSRISWSLGAHLENLLLTGDAATDGTGNNLANVITGNAAANVLLGGGRADTLIGGGGDDLYLIDATDVLIEQAGGGNDTVVANATFALSDHIEVLRFNGTANVRGDGNAEDNFILGNVGNNRLLGHDGNDTLNGGLGNDTLQGGEGADSLVGGEGVDRLDGGNGNDTYVLADLDLVIEAANAGIDTVLSNIAYTLPNTVENLTLLGSGDIAGTGNALDNVLIGNGGANVLRGLAGADSIAGGQAGDTLEGGAGADTLAGSGGADYFLWRAPLEGGDTLVDFRPAEDKLALVAGGFGGLAVVTLSQNTAAGGAPQFIYTKASGLLQWDADGTGAGAAVMIATLSNKPTLFATDFVIV